MCIGVSEPLFSAWCLEPDQWGEEVENLDELKLVTLGIITGPYPKCFCRADGSLRPSQRAMETGLWA